MIRLIDGTTIHAVFTATGHTMLNDERYYAVKMLPPVHIGDLLCVNEVHGLLPAYRCMDSPTKENVQ